VYNDTLARLRDIAQDVAREQNVAFADVYTAMMQTMKSAKAALGEKYEVAGSDGFHPNNNGGLIMAYAFLKAMGCDGDIGTITVDLASGSATATEGHKVLSRGGDGIEIESTRYPFCFSKSPDGQADSPVSTREIIRFFPFNEELNRLRLVVNNAGAPRLRVTWGSAAKDFSADELAKGINLAAEFLDNPFSEQFAKVESLIRNHQGFEIPMIKSFVTKMAQFNEMAPGNQDCLDRIEQGMAKRRESMVAEAAAAVVPVRHVIKIEKVR
jgi:hypothetical protein